MQSFREFVDLLQEASGDRQKKLTQLKSDIDALEKRIKNSQNANDRYERSGEGDEHRAELNKLKAKLRRYQPEKGPSKKQKRTAALKRDEDLKQKQQERKEREAFDAEEKRAKDEIHNKAKFHADSYVAKNHPAPPRKPGEDIIAYHGRTADEQKNIRDVHFKKYHAERTRLSDERKKS